MNRDVKKCIINLSTLNAWFSRGQERLDRTVRAQGFDGEVILWNHEEDVGAPPHKESPYSFKTHAFQFAKDAGFDLVLWLDASMWATKSIQPVFDQMEAQGHVMEQAGWAVGQWCTDAALQTLGVTRDEAMGISMFSAGFLGLNLRNARSAEFLRIWHEKSQDGVSFLGDWTNERQQCSTDPRCLGHRHDMTAGSVIAHRLEMPIAPPTFMVYDHGAYFPETACIRCRGVL